VRPQHKTTASSPHEALAICLDVCGHLDLGHIAHLLSIPEEMVPERLGALAFEDPGTRTWLPASEYLSGDVRAKLAAARAIVEHEAGFGRNVTALEQIQPEELAPEEITALLGASWIPPEDIVQFCREIFKFADVQVTYEQLTGTWEVVPPWNALSDVAITSQWGTSRMNAFVLLEHGLNKKTPVVYDVIDDRRVRNGDDTLAAQEKLALIAARFSAWIWEDDTRADRLASRYNRVYNATVSRVYDGSHLSFPGMSDEWIAKLYPWQRDFVWRMVSSRSALCGHPVGAGKTTTQIAGAMTLKRFSLISRAAIAVPDHLLEQIAAEAARLYPGARVLIVSRDDLSRDRRKLFAARVATGDYDIVIMTHASLGALGVHPETERLYLEKKVAAYRQVLMNLEEEEGQHKHSIKRLEKAIERLRQRQAALLDRPRDDGITFEQLGISYLIIDEAQLFKNLGLPTNIESLQVIASKRAIDLEMKLHWLEEHNQGRPFGSFFTATPISNNLVEAYVLDRKSTRLNSSHRL